MSENNNDLPSARSNQNQSQKDSTSVTEKAVAVLVLGAVVAISYVIWRQKKDHHEILKLIEERERKRDEYRHKQD